MHMPSPLPSVFIALLGIPVMIAGLVLWFLPIVPGAPIFLIGLAMSIGWHPKGRFLVSRIKEGLRSFARRFGGARKSAAEMKTELLGGNPETKDS